MTIADGSWWNPGYGGAFVSTRTAPAGSLVNLNVHPTGTPANNFSLVRTVTPDRNGNWTRSIVADANYRYFANVGAAKSQTALFQPAPTIDHPVSRVVARNKAYTHTSRVIPGHRALL